MADEGRGVTSTPLVPLTRTRRDANHDALATAAFALARQHGLDGFTLDDVAREVGVSRRTFFNHFVSKEQAVCEVARVRFASILESVPECDPDASMESAVRALLAPDTVSDVRALIALAEQHPALVPHLSALQLEIADHVADAVTDRFAGTDGMGPVHAYALPGAVVAVVIAVYRGRLHVREVDGEAPGALALVDVVTQLEALAPHLPPAR